MSNPQLPRELEAEKAVLGAILINDSKLDLVQESGLSSTDFFHYPHKKIFEVVVELAAKNQKIDLYLLTSALRDRGLLEQVGGVATLTGLFDHAAFSMANIEHYGKLIRDKGLQRNIINTCAEVMNEGLAGVDDIDEYVNSTESKIFEITKNKKSKSFLVMFFVFRLDILVIFSVIFFKHKNSVCVLSDSKIIKIIELQGNFW